MTRRNIKEYSGPQLGMGIYDFPENKAILKRYGTPKPLSVYELFLRDTFNERYHGNDRPGCCLVKKKREITNEVTLKDGFVRYNYIDIYTCLHCGEDIECLKSGWEIHWYGGTYSPKLK